MQVSELDRLSMLINNTIWADRTKKNRINFIKLLHDELAPNSQSLEFLQDYELVVDYLLNKYSNTNTRKTKILDVRSLLVLLKDTKIIQKYDALSDTLIDENNEVRDNNIINHDKYLDWDKIIKLPNIISDNIKFIYNKLFLSHDDIDNLKTKMAKYRYLKILIMYIVSCLYTQIQPVRTDWSNVLLDKCFDNENWLDMTNSTIHWRQFKNVKSLGPQDFKLNNNIISNLNKYIDILNYIIPNPTYLLYQIHNSTFKPFTREIFSSYFIKLNKKYFNKALNINSYRHSYETNFINSDEYNKMTNAQKKEIHLRLLHTPSTAHENYLKVEAN